MALFERSTSSDWQRVELPPGHDDLTWLRIIRNLTHDSVCTAHASRECFDPEDESDEEAIPRDQSTAPVPWVVYSILLSPVYRVPVLYFSLHNLPVGSDLSAERIHELIVPPQLSAQIRSVGVIGGISMTVSINGGT